MAMSLPRPYGRARAGRTRDAREAVQAWTTAAWLLAVEGRAYLEDLDGGVHQPEMRAVVKLRLLELFADLDARLAGARAPGEDHLLSIAVEYGFDELIQLDGDELMSFTEIHEGLLTTNAADAGIRELFQSLVDGFPGQLPNPLAPEGQSEILRAMQIWSRLASGLEMDIAYLSRFLEDA